jgi:hypothetical protein
LGSIKAMHALWRFLMWLTYRPFAVLISDVYWRAFGKPTGNLVQEEAMAAATTVSLAKFTASVQAAVKNASAKHPKFQVEEPKSIAVSYLIRGFPAPEALAKASIAEAQAFANDVASSLAQAHPELLSRSGGQAQGAVISVGRHIILGFPPVTEVFNLER